MKNTRKTLWIAASMFAIIGVTAALIILERQSPMNTTSNLTAATVIPPPSSTDACKKEAIYATEASWGEGKGLNRTKSIEAAMLAAAMKLKMKLNEEEMEKKKKDENYPGYQAETIEKATFSLRMECASRRDCSAPTSLATCDFLNFDSPRDIVKRCKVIDLVKEEKEKGEPYSSTVTCTWDICKMQCKADTTCLDPHIATKDFLIPEMLSQPQTTGPDSLQEICNEWSVAAAANTKLSPKDPSRTIYEYTMDEKEIECLEKSTLAITCSPTRDGDIDIVKINAEEKKVTCGWFMKCSGRDPDQPHVGGFF